MSARTGLLPPSVESLNALLRDRGAADRGQEVALGISYGAHLLLLVLIVLAGRSTRYVPFGGPTSAGIMAVTPLYSPGAPPGPRPDRQAAAPAPPAEEARPLREERSPPRPEPEDLLREAKPEARTGRRAPTARAAEPAPKRGGTEKLGGGTLPSATGPPGSPTGTIGGDPDGGLTALMFTNQWYVARVQDIVYSNWGDPFLGLDRPKETLATVIRFRIHRDGRITDVELEKPGGNAAWDRSALRAVENSTLPPLPPDYTGASVLVHYEFRLDPTL